VVVEPQTASFLRQLAGRRDWPGLEVQWDVGARNWLHVLNPDTGEWYLFHVDDLPWWIPNLARGKRAEPERRKVGDLEGDP